MSEYPAPLPEEIKAPPPQPVHTFALAIGPDGNRQLLIFKRTDLREIEQVGFVWIGDKGVSAKEIGAGVAMAFDLELVSRGSPTQPGENSNG